MIILSRQTDIYVLYSVRISTRAEYVKESSYFSNEIGNI